MKTSKSNIPIVWQDKATNSLDEIFQFVANDSIEKAFDLIDKIKEKTSDLAFWAEKYQKETLIDTQRNIRRAVVYSYKIVYEVKPDAIYILDIFHTAQNPNKLNKL